jgi:hypothetical protein
MILRKTVSLEFDYRFRRSQICKCASKEVSMGPLRWLAAFTGLLIFTGGAASVAAAEVPPPIGKPVIMPLSQVTSGMKATVWTVFEGSKPEAVPVEIIGVWRNAFGPKQDVILGKMGGRVLKTGVAGGMSGSPAYIDGKLIGAVSLRIGAFTPDPICGITPIENMLEVNRYDPGRPMDARGPGSVQRAMTVPNDVHAAAAGLQMVPIDTPISMAGFTSSAMEQFAPMMRQMGISAVQGGAAGGLKSTRLAADWQTALKPGEVINQILVSGDMSMAAMCTVTYNDGKNVLGCGHPVLNSGPINMPIAKGEVLMVLGSSLSPNKIGNATDVVGALRQDRHSAIGGELGGIAEMIPVKLNVRNYGDDGRVKSSKQFRYEVFVDQKWTPYLMLVTAFNTVSSINDFSENTTYRVNGKIGLEGGKQLELSTLVSPVDFSMMPTGLQMASWWGDKFNQLFANPSAMPKLGAVELDIDLLPERRQMQVESAYLSSSRVAPGDEVLVKVFLKPYRGARVEREVKIKIPEGASAGEHRILLSDGETLNRLRGLASRSERPNDVAQTVALLKQERRSDRMYVSLIEPGATVYTGDKAMPSLPASALSVMQSARAGGMPLPSQPESLSEQGSIALDYVVTGSYMLRVQVK